MLSKLSGTHDPLYFFKYTYTIQHNKTNQYKISVAGKEIKARKFINIQMTRDMLATLKSRIFSWKRVQSIMGYVLLFIHNMKQKQVSKAQN